MCRGFEAFEGNDSCDKRDFGGYGGDWGRAFFGYTILL